MLKHITHILLTLSILCSITSYAVVDSTNGTGGGTWNTGSTWMTGVEPVCPDSIIILTGDSVYISNNLNFSSCGPIYLLIQGTLQFKTGSKLILASGSTLDVGHGSEVIPGGGGGNSNYIQIGTANVWSAEDSTLTGPVIIDESGPVPIKLISFSGTITTYGVELVWITESEINNDYFTIERSRDGFFWYDIAEIQGSGNSNIKMVYNFIDNTFILGVNYYRLTQTDFDGRFELFDTISFNTTPNIKFLEYITINFIGQLMSKDYDGLRIVIWSDGYAQTIRSLKKTPNRIK